MDKYLKFRATIELPVTKLEVYGISGEINILQTFDDAEMQCIHLTPARAKMVITWLQEALDAIEA
jgi:hypothetical protein